MSQDPVLQQRTNTFLKILIALVIAGGIIARLVVYLQNRNLIIDEANVTRNLFERGFAQLLQPLSYEQYAPPVFLWIEKLNTILFGFSEYTLRLYPLLTGIAAIFVMLAILKRLTSFSSLWYPLILFCASHILIRYSSEVKQYMPDVLITLSLILLAMKIKPEQFSRIKFMIIWVVLGSAAIWSCMPSVFILAGIGAYYGWIALRGKNYKGLADIAFVALCWLAQFAIYYVAILEPQANSDYLQNFHQYNFLFATPDDASEWVHNWAVVNALIRQVGGWPFTLVINTLLILLGAIAWLRRDAASALLVIVPLAALLVAAAFNQYSLLPRVALFSIPLFIILIGYGFYTVMRTNSSVAKIVCVIIGVYSASGTIIKTVQSQFKFEQITDGLEFARQKGITGDYLYIYHSSVPAFLYYTDIHPEKASWKDMKNGASFLSWDTQYPSLSWEMKYSWLNTLPVAFIFTNATREVSSLRAAEMSKYMTATGQLDKPGIRVFIYQKQ